jgi:hypothetical protein
MAAVSRGEICQVRQLLLLITAAASRNKNNKQCRTFLSPKPSKETEQSRAAAATVFTTRDGTVDSLSSLSSS